MTESLSSLPILVYCVLVVGGAGFVRGYAGFGFSALVVAGISLAMPPAEIVPVVLVLEVLASLLMLPSVRVHVDWRWVVRIALSAAIAAPLGVAALRLLPETPVRIVLSLLILAASLLLWRGGGWRAVHAPGVQFVIGALAGLVNGLGAIGGLVLALSLVAGEVPARVFRASLVALFLLMDLTASALMLGNGLWDRQRLLLLVVLVLPMAAGIRLGSRRFMRVAPESFRRASIVLLMLLAVLGLARAALAVWSASPGP